MIAPTRREAAHFRNSLSLGTSMSALGAAMLVFGATAAQAQVQGQAPAAEAPAAAENDTDIVVTGFRAALRSATAKKKTSETVLESVSAEDIGKLPDNGIGESIARLPGISAQRNAGRANIISIRGFGPDFSSTTLNGRQQTTTNDSRAVEFDQYPSEILAGVDVYKTAEADHTAGGLVGSIDLRTIRPLDVSKRVLAVGARGTYTGDKVDPNASNAGYRVYGTFVDKFADDRVGVALSVAYTDEPYSNDDFNAWGFGGYPGGGQGMNGIKTYVETDKLKRFGANGTVQGQLDDNLRVTIDGFYSHFVDRIDQRGFEMPFNCGGGCGHDAITNVTTNSAGLVTAATIAGTPLIENYANDRVADQFSAGINGTWDNHNGWHAVGDFSWSHTNRTDDSLQTTAGLGRALPNATAVVSYKATPTGPQFTSNYNGANPALVLTDVEGWSGSPVQAGYDNFRRTKDDLVEARGEIERDIGGFLKSIKAGVDYTTRSKTLSAREAYLSPPNGALTAAIPTNLLLSPVNLDRGFGPILAYDPRTLVSNGVLVYNANPFGATKGYGIQEDVVSPYVMAKLDGHFGSSTLTGNIGVQGVHTDVTSSGQASLTIKDSYWMVLPSANLNLRTENGFVIRLAGSKEYMRARLPDLNNVFSVGIDRSTIPGTNFYNGSGGNPRLRPYQAWAVDLNIEKYFGNKGYIALQGFYKYIDTYIASGTYRNYDYAGVPNLDTTAPAPTTTIGFLSTSVNTHGGEVYGAELAGTLPFDIFAPGLAGFGVTGGGGYTHTKITDFNGNISTIPGYSKWVASLTAFYEKNGLNIRGSARYRSAYLGDFALYSGGLDRQNVLGETIYDAQIGYDFQEASKLHGLSLYVQGQNLANTRSATLGTADPLSYLKYQTYGRRYVAGFTFKF